MKSLLYIIFLTIAFISCSHSGNSSNTTKNEISKDTTPYTSVDNSGAKIAPNEAKEPKFPLIYDKSKPLLRGSYGEFGSYDVGYEDIVNHRYSGRLITRFYYPKGINKKAPLVLFFSGWGINNPDSYKAILYFIASKGVNVAFVTCPDSDVKQIPSTIREDILERYKDKIDRSLVGFVGHSSGASYTFWIAREFKDELGDKGRFIYTLASDYTIFYEDYYIPAKKIIELPLNTNLIIQMYSNDMTTDLRIGADLFYNNSLPLDKKDFMFVFGLSHDGCMGKNGYDFDANMQRSIFRPLDALIDKTFNNNQNAIVELKKEIKDDPYYHPYIGKDIPKSYIKDSSLYDFSCSQSHVRDKWCKENGF